MKTWYSFFFNELRKESIRNLLRRVNESYLIDKKFPEHKNILRAFINTPYEAVKAVIIGQDPYHEQGQAQGLAFSVPSGLKLPPSLVNIYKEYSADLGYPVPSSGDLTSWTKEGVLLINSILTVKEHQAFSDDSKEYQELFKDLIKFLNESDHSIVFILWGNSAYRYSALINSKKHLIIHSAHPSPLSCYRGFYSSKPFSKTNEYLSKINVTPINWKL